MSLYKLAYIYPETLPSKYARSISVVNTAHEIANFIDCTLFIENNSEDKILKYYNIKNSKLKIQKLQKKLLYIKSNKIFNHNLLKKLRTEKFDYIYARHIKVAKFLIEKGYNVIFECHEIFYKSNQKTREIEKYVYQNAAGLVFINNTLKDELNKYFNIKDIPQITIHNGCNFCYSYIKKDFSIINQIYYIGNFYPWKGVDFLIKAISNTKIKLKIIGDGDRKKELQEYVEKNNIKNVEFLGYKSQESIKKILYEAKLTVIPNIPSNFSYFSSPVKLYEYLMTSNIVLSSDIPTIKEIIKHKKNGFLFKSGNESSFKKTLDYILSLDNSRLQEIAKNGYKTSREFTWENRAKNIVSFLKKLDHEKANLS